MTVGPGPRTTVGVPRDVFAQWDEWLAAGDTARVRADLADLLAKTDGPPPGPERDPDPERRPKRDPQSRPDREPPSTSPGPAISTR